MTKKTATTTDSGRGRTQRLRKSKGRKESSTRWLKRQLSGPYVAEAQERGLRSRAAFKLIELDDRFHFLKPGGRVVDLGAAPGGWTVVAVDRVNAQGIGKGNQGCVVGIDIQDTDPVGGATLICHDFMDEDAPGMLKDALNGPADVVLSDMAAPATENTLLAEMKKRFATIKHAKPPSSRKESAETYVVAMGFKG